MAQNSLTDLITTYASGKGFFGATMTLGPGSTTTAGAAASGFYSCQIFANNIGTTFPSTIQGFPTIPTPTSNIMTAVSCYGLGSAKGYVLGHFYLMGTLNLAATGDNFTHNAATFPILRTQMGVASQPVVLIPIIQISTATATTAPVFWLRTNAGAAGYTDQDSNSVIGTRTMTMPAAATAVNSAFIIRLENGDSGVIDISNIEVTTAGTAGAANIWGFEPISALSSPVTSYAAINDNVTMGISTELLKPGSSTGGSLSSFLGLLATSGANSTTTNTIFYSGIINA